MVAPDRDKLRRAFRADRGDRAGGDPGDPGNPGDDGAAEVRPPERGDVRAFLRARQAAMRGTPRARVELPTGEVLQTRGGPLWRRELRVPLTAVHGTVPLARVRRLDGEHLARIAKGTVPATLATGRCVFLDTETTGLSTGAGTMVFAYGLAFVRGDELVFEQLFVRDFTEEPAVLRHVAARLWQFEAMVTFVGKSFDRHRIATRMALCRVPSPVLLMPHLDLYHVTRRVHGHALPDTRLRTVEERLLGFRRHDDLPGSEAPAAFLDWIRDGSGPIDRVLEHNRLDVLSLCALLGLLAGAGETGTPPVHAFR